MLVYSKCLAGDEDGSAGSQRNIASSVSYCSSSHSSCRIVTCSCYDFDICGETKFLCNFRFQCSNNFPALIQLRELFFFYITDFHHFFRPAAILYVQKQHSGCIRNICAEGSGKSVCKVVFRKHDLCDLCKFLWLIFFHPQDLWCCKSSKSDICCILR